MNGLIKYFAERKLVRLNKQIETLQGELTYYSILKEEGSSSMVPKEHEEKLKIKLNDLYSSHGSLYKRVYGDNKK